LTVRETAQTIQHTKDADFFTVITTRTETRMFKIERLNGVTRIVSYETGDVIKEFTGPNQNIEARRFVPFAECENGRAA
jgi:hypothetical protein